MQTPETKEIQAEAIKILNTITDTSDIKEVKYLCNDGYVAINVKNNDFTYCGDFGSYVMRCLFALKADFNNLQDKVFVLAYCVLHYSMNNGGFNVISINK
jgi:hypothetical protein